MDDAELKVGGYTFKAAHLLFAAPLVSALAGGIYWGYDTLQRFLDVEQRIDAVVDVEGRVQSLEQTVGDNDVRGLSSRLADISTRMQTILEQQATLLDLRARVERSSAITDNLDATLQRHSTEIEDLWKAFDELASNPIR
jgi:hypothetical protein